MTRIDPETRARIHAVLALCRSKGLDPVPVLDAAGLLDYESKRLEARIKTVHYLIDSIQAVAPSHFPPVRASLTVLDVKNYIVDYLQACADGLTRKKERR